VALPSFNEFWTDARAQSERAGVQNEGERDAFALKIINEVMFTKLVTVFASVLDASAISSKTPNWLVVDRISSCSPAAELLLEAAMKLTESRPPIVVIDSFDRLKKFTGQDGEGLGEITQSCIDKCQLVKQGAVPLGVDDAPQAQIVEQFYEEDDFMDPNLYFDMKLPLAIDDSMLGPDGKIPPREKWSYHYKKTFFGAGTHYILLDSEIDAPDLSALGPFGYLAANGGGDFLPRLKKLIQTGKSIVMLDKTGGVTHGFTSLRRGMLSTLPPPPAAQLLQLCELTSPAEWTRQFGLPEIHMLKELNQRAPMLLKNTIVSVDLMEDNSEQVLSVLVTCFSGGGGIPELGLGEAEMLCVLTAWKRHMTLWANADKFERIADRLQLLLYSLAIITTLAAILYTAETGEMALAALGGGEEGEEGQEGEVAAEASGRVLRRLQSLMCPGGEVFTCVADPPIPESEGEIEGGPAPPSEAPPIAASNEVIAGMTWWGLSVVMLPVLSAGVGTLRTRMRPREKWASCLMAAHQVVDQIYKYRLRTDVYDVMAPQVLEEGQEARTPKQRNMDARLAFVATVSTDEEYMIASSQSYVVRHVDEC
jgi:hypothetical protein